MNRRDFSILSALTLLSGCGFHLRGLNTDKITISVLSFSVEGNMDTQSISVFQDVLRENNIREVSEGECPWHIIFSEFKRSRIQTALGGNDNDEVRELELTDSYQITLLHNGKPSGTIRVSNRTNVQYSSAQYIGSEEEESNAHKRLAEENAYATLRFLNAKADDNPAP